MNRSDLIDIYLNKIELLPDYAKRLLGDDLIGVIKSYGPKFIALSVPDCFVMFPITDRAEAIKTITEFLNRRCNCPHSGYATLNLWHEYDIFYVWGIMDSLIEYLETLKDAACQHNFISGYKRYDGVVFDIDENQDIYQLMEQFHNCLKAETDNDKKFELYRYAHSILDELPTNNEYVKMCIKYDTYLVPYIKNRQLLDYLNNAIELHAKNDKFCTYSHCGGSYYTTIEYPPRDYCFLEPVINRFTILEVLPELPAVKCSIDTQCPYKFMESFVSKIT